MEGSCPRDVIAQLEAELALQKKYSEELKSSQDGKGFFEKFG